MSRMGVVLVARVALFAPWFTTTVHAQNDHLQCFKVRDPVRLRATVDVTAPQIDAATGCTITGATLFCTAAAKTVVSATSNGSTLTPLPYTGPPTETDRLCYKLKCPTAVIPGHLVTDQFGTRTLPNFRASMLCTPAVQGAVFCGNGTVDAGEQCDMTNQNGATCQSLGFLAGTLTCAPGCTFDTSGCTGHIQLLATGQTYCWDASLNVIPCAGTSQDGETRIGTPLAYIDNGDGTITDINTELMWEKQSAYDGTIHDFNSGAYAPSWDAVLMHVATLNAASFAGHTDWRVPNVRELESIVNYGTLNPTVAPAFNNNCTFGVSGPPACTVLTCSCTQPNAYWSSTNTASEFWSVSFVWLFGISCG